MVYTTDGTGAAIDLEVWELPVENFGHFMLQASSGHVGEWLLPARTLHMPGAGGHVI